MLTQAQVAAIRMAARMDASATIRKHGSQVANQLRPGTDDPSA
jgi:hypothetical protein